MRKAHVYEEMAKLCYEVYAVSFKFSCSLSLSLALILICLKIASKRICEAKIKIHVVIFDSLFSSILFIRNSTVWRFNFLSIHQARRRFQDYFNQISTTTTTTTSTLSRAELLTRFCFVTSSNIHFVGSFSLLSFFGRTRVSEQRQNRYFLASIRRFLIRPEWNKVNTQQQ